MTARPLIELMEEAALDTLNRHGDLWRGPGDYGWPPKDPKGMGISDPVARTLIGRGWAWVAQMGGREVLTLSPAGLRILHRAELARTGYEAAADRALKRAGGGAAGREGRR
jgi:hypothetical protein